MIFRRRFCLPLLILTLFGCDPESQKEAAAAALDPRLESAYLTMPPSSPADFSSSVRCLYTGRLLPLNQTVQFSETAQMVLLPGTEATAPAADDSRWKTASEFAIGESGLYTLFLRRQGETGTSRYRWIATKSFGTVSQLTIKAETPTVKGWAYRVVDYCPGKDLTSFTDPERALGNWFAHRSETISDPVYDVVSLGNGGSLTLEWKVSACNGIGPDFAVFENGITANENSVFAELAFVEVSSDGVHFERFDSVSNGRERVVDGGQIAADSIYGLAGAKPLGYGTLFDLDELAGREAVLDGRLDLNRVRFLRLIDISGCEKNVDGYEASFDSFGNLIFDAFKTYGSAGFDAACTAVLNSCYE